MPLSKQHPQSEGYLLKTLIIFNTISMHGSEGVNSISGAQVRCPHGAQCLAIWMASALVPNLDFTSAPPARAKRMAEDGCVAL